MIRNIEIAEFIVYSIMLLLQKTGPENLKCVCQTLKVTHFIFFLLHVGILMSLPFQLCGFELDVDLDNRTEQIVHQLEPHKATNDTSTSRLIQSVVDLRSKRWGRTETFCKTLFEHF